MTIEEFDKGIVQRYLEGPHCPSAWKACKTLAGLADQAWPADEFDRDEFTDRLAKVLGDGDFHYVVAAQKFTPQMTRTLEYLNTVAQAGHYHLVQMIQFNGPDMTVYAAQVHHLADGSAPRRRRVSSRPLRKPGGSADRQVVATRNWPPRVHRAAFSPADVR